MLGLILIAFGTGGIKPCVSAFGGDQFEEEHVRYSWHVFAIVTVILQLVNYIITEHVSSLQLGYSYIIIELASSVALFSISFINHIV